MVNGFDGRFLYVKYKENDNKYDIINVYVFNDVRERVMFLKNIINVMLCLIELIIMGDFNNIFVEIDRCGKIVYKYDQSYKVLIDMMIEYDVVDIWR